MRVRLHQRKSLRLLTRNLSHSVGNLPLKATQFRSLAVRGHPSVDQYSYERLPPRISKLAQQTQLRLPENSSQPRFAYSKLLALCRPMNSRPPTVLGNPVKLSKSAVKPRSRVPPRPPRPLRPQNLQKSPAVTHEALSRVRLPRAYKQVSQALRENAGSPPNAWEANSRKNSFLSLSDLVS